MEGIFLTEKGKTEIISKIKKFEQEIAEMPSCSLKHGLIGKKWMLKEILETAKIIPDKDER